MSTQRVGMTAAATLVLCLAAGCAHPKSERLKAGSPDVITEDDIARVRVRTAYDAVVRIHANFLTRRGSTSVLGTSNPEPNVYLDDVFIGAVAQLKGIQASDVASIRLYRAWEAATRFGGGNMGGVIEVYTKH
jgi:TonB-dependent receptor-like protein